MYSTSLVIENTRALVRYIARMKKEMFLLSLGFNLLIILGLVSLSKVTSCNMLLLLISSLSLPLLYVLVVGFRALARTSFRWGVSIQLTSKIRN